MDETRTTEEGHRATGFVAGLLCGAAVGATLGLLFAPKPGSELRRDIADGAGKLRRRAEEAYEKRVSRRSDDADDESRFGDQAIDEVVARGQKAARRAANVVDQARNVMNDARRPLSGSDSIS